MLKTFFWKNREVYFFWIAEYADAETTHEPDSDSGARLSFNAYTTDMVYLEGNHSSLSPLSS